MARYKSIDTSSRFLVVDLERQLLHGSFEHVLNYLIDHELEPPLRTGSIKPTSSELPLLQAAKRQQPALTTYHPIYWLEKLLTGHALRQKNVDQPVPCWDGEPMAPQGAASATLRPSRSTDRDVVSTSWKGRQCRQFH